MEEVDISEFWPEWTVGPLIGRGGYGNVYVVEREALGVRVRSAMKVVNIPRNPSEIATMGAQGARPKDVVAELEGRARRLTHEIAAMQSLKTSSNVVTIEDFHTEVASDEVRWTFYIRMELLQSLPDYLREHGALTQAEAANMCVDVCRALECCAELGIVHRDVKPANIFRERFGAWRLGDFGIAREVGSAAAAAMTNAGTPAYEAPEVTSGRAYDATVDTYSLGIVLYQQLNGGRLPFQENASLGDAVARRLGADELPAIPGVDIELDAVVRRSCAKDPAARYGSAAEMRAALETWLRGRGAERAQARDAAEDPAATEPSPAPQAEEDFLSQVMQAFVSSRGAAPEASSSNHEEGAAPEGASREATNLTVATEPRPAQADVPGDMDTYYVWAAHDNARANRNFPEQPDAEEAAAPEPDHLASAAEHEGGVSLEARDAVEPPHPTPAAEQSEDASLAEREVANILADEQGASQLRTFEQATRDCDEMPNIDETLLVSISHEGCLLGAIVNGEVCFIELARWPGGTEFVFLYNAIKRTCKLADFKSVVFSMPFTSQDVRRVSQSLDGLVGKFAGYDRNTSRPRIVEPRSILHASVSALIGDYLLRSERPQGPTRVVLLTSNRYLFVDAFYVRDSLVKRLTTGEFCNVPVISAEYGYIFHDNRYAEHSLENPEILEARLAELWGNICAQCGSPAGGFCPDELLMLGSLAENPQIQSLARKVIGAQSCRVLPDELMVAGLAPIARFTKGKGFESQRCLSDWCVPWRVEASVNGSPRIELFYHEEFLPAFREVSFKNVSANAEGKVELCLYLTTALDTDDASLGGRCLRKSYDAPNCESFICTFDVSIDEDVRISFPDDMRWEEAGLSFSQDGTPQLPSVSSDIHLSAVKSAVDAMFASRKHGNLHRIHGQDEDNRRTCKIFAGPRKCEDPLFISQDSRPVKATIFGHHTTGICGSYEGLYHHAEDFSSTAWSWGTFCKLDIEVVDAQQITIGGKTIISRNAKDLAAALRAGQAAYRSHVGL